MKFIEPYLKKTNTAIVIALYVLFIASAILFRQKAFYFFSMHYVCIAACFFMLFIKSFWKRSDFSKDEKPPSILLCFLKIGIMQCLVFTLIATLPVIGLILPVPPSTQPIHLDTLFVSTNLIAGFMPWGAALCIAGVWANAALSRRKWTTITQAYEDIGMPKPLHAMGLAALQYQLIAFLDYLPRLAMVCTIVLTIHYCHIPFAPGTSFTVIIASILTSTILEETPLFKHAFNALNKKIKHFFLLKCCYMVIILLTTLVMILAIGTFSTIYGEPLQLLVGPMGNSIENFFANAIKYINFFHAQGFWLLLTLSVNLLLLPLTSYYIAFISQGQRFAWIILFTLTLPLLTAGYCHITPHAFQTVLASNHIPLKATLFISSALLLLYQFAGTQSKTSMIANTLIYAQKNTTRLKSSSRLHYNRPNNWSKWHFIYLFGSVGLMTWEITMNALMLFIALPFAASGVFKAMKEHYQRNSRKQKVEPHH